MVLSPEGYLVDLREDVFLPILLTRGLAADGIIDAEFQWCQKGSQIRLEEVGSDAHKRYLSEDQKFSKARKIGARDLKVGTVYSCQDGYRVYAGRVRHESKLKFAWIHWYDYLSQSTNYQHQVDHNWRNSALRYHLQVTGTPSIQEEVASVSLPDVSKVRHWLDGWNSRLFGTCTLVKSKEPKRSKK